MSYLVDALKKAEQERRAEQAGDLRAATHAEHARAGSAGALWRWALALLLASNVALIGYIWRPQAANAPAPAASASGDVSETSKAQSPAAMQPAPVISRHRVAAPAPASQASVNEPPPRSRTPATQPAAPVGDQDTAGTTRSASTDHSHGGRVTYSRVPLTNDGTTAAPSASDENGPGSSDEGNPGALDTRPASTPTVTINGQLYSTVPGRSFILVNGRRYHEGERLAAGPAVEQIEPSGAVLRYQGQRYRVPGPN